MSMRKVAKLLSMTAILSVVCCIFGCGRLPEYTVDDIRSVSISCGHMDYSYSYSFYIRKAENEWLFDADFALNTEEPRVEFENCSVDNEDVKELLDIVRDREVIKNLRHYKKPKIKLQISDETTYYTSVLFSDGEQAGAPILINQDIETYFYRLGEKYTDMMSETNKT